MFCFLEQFARKDDHGVGCITHLGFLGLRCHHEQFCSWMYDFDLFDDGGSIGRDEQSTQVIDQEFITTFLYISRFSGTNGEGRGHPTHHLVQNLSVRDLIALKRPGCCAEQRPRVLADAKKPPLSIGQLDLCVFTPCSLP